MVSGDKKQGGHFWQDDSTRGGHKYVNTVMKLIFNSKQTLSLIFGPAGHCFVLNLGIYFQQIFSNEAEKFLVKLV